MDARTCKTCGIKKYLTEFPLEKNCKDGHRRVCKLCRNDYHKTVYNRSGPGLKNSRLLRQYGITLNQYNQMLEEQGGLCFICNKKSKNFWGTLLAVDHDHKTGKVRRLLCDKCNKGLGQFDDNPELLRKAALYIEEH